MQLKVHTVDTWPLELLLVIKASNGRLIRASHARYVGASYARYVAPRLSEQDVSARSLLRRRHEERNDDDRNDDERNHDETESVFHDETRHALSLHGIPVLPSPLCVALALSSR